MRADLTLTPAPPLDTAAEPAPHAVSGAALPRAPRTPDETGLPFLFLFELVSKVLFQQGQVRLIDLASHLRLTTAVLDPLIAYLRTEKQCEAQRRGASGTDADLIYQLTDLGRERAITCLRRSAYAGPAPVTLAAYCSQVEAQSVAQMQVLRSDVARVFDGVVVSPAVLDQIGAAMNSRRAIFLHGPAGSGKTFLAERLAGLLKGGILVPHAVMVDGEVVQIYDPAVHRPADDAAVPAEQERFVPRDTRWVACARPAVMTGGELTLDMLDLRFDAGTRFSQAPAHLKANNGIFIVDDLGRQRCSTLELMNRWIVPLDRHVDSLSLHTGFKFMVPFDVVVVFSSNRAPQELSDSAFMRRLGYKIHLGELTTEQYEQIFLQVCEQVGIANGGAGFPHLLRHHLRDGQPLLACTPRDILAQLRDRARYEGIAPVLNDTTLAWAWNNYFSDAGH